MRINTLTSSLFALSQLSRTQKAFQRALSRLASGQRINSAADDPAGLAIATGLEAQRRGVAQAIRNLNDARGFLNTAEGAMQTQSDIVQRMRELALQASNGILSSESRSYLETEFQQLYSEFKRITSQTEFNGVALLDGTFGTKSLQVGTQKNSTIDFNLASMKSEAVFTQTVTCGDGTFSSRRTFASAASGAWPNDSAAADFNGDGNLDLVVVNKLNSTSSILLGNGDGTFGSYATYADGANSTNAWSNPVIGDFNGDDILDFASSNATDNTISLFYGNGNGTFQSRITIAGTAPSSMDAADINGDGLTDIVARTTAAVTVYIARGNGAFDSTVYGMNGNGPLLRDINGDGKLDLTIGMHVRLGNGDGTFGNGIATGLSGSAGSENLADVNGDGKLDLISFQRDENAININLGNGDGTFQTRTTIAAGDPNSPFGYTYAQVRVLDIDGDGKMDLVSTAVNDSTIRVYRGRGNGTFHLWSTFTGGLYTNGLRTYDVNNDGVLDLVVADGGDGNDNTISVYTANTTTRVNNPSVTISTQSSASTMLEVMDNALKYINASRSKIGAYLSRIDSAESVNSRLQENLSAARSQIMDADMAQETAEFVRLQILQQAGLSVLSQARINARLSLKLLENL